MDSAGFFIRVLAALLDLIILTAITWILGLIMVHTSDPSDMQDDLMTIFLIVGMLYSVGSWMKWGATPGKLALRLRVVRMQDGGNVRWHQGLARWVSYLVSASVFGAGFLMAAFHPLKRTIHDLLSQTRVVRLSSRRRDT